MYLHLLCENFARNSASGHRPMTFDPLEFGSTLGLCLSSKDAVQSLRPLNCASSRLWKGHRRSLDVTALLLASPPNNIFYGGTVMGVYTILWRIECKVGVSPQIKINI